MSDNSNEFYCQTLKGCRHVMAPMVDQSELAFRLLGRLYYGIQCCYTPMINANSFINNIKYRNQCLQTSPEDRPLILQFCANNTEVLLKASKLAVGHCDAIDINLGCPQAIAKRGHYGAFLMDEWHLIYDMISRISSELKVPITCKIRIFADLNKTIDFAKMLEKAGVSMICVHGRRREQKGPQTGLADWTYIKAIKEAVKVPVFANGNILSLSDVEKCFNEIPVEAVMSAEGLLHNPALFTGKPVAVWTVAEQYLNLVNQYPCPLSYTRGHIFKFFHHCFMLESNEDLREKVAKAHTIDVFENVTKELKNRYEKQYNSESIISNNWTDGSTLPPYICQPYIRPEPKPIISMANKRSPEDDNIETESKKLSKKKLKRMNRSINHTDRVRAVSKRILCTLCPNPKAEKCDYNFCRSCCRKKTFEETLDCTGHKFQMKGRLIKKMQNNDILNDNNK
ncbi:tRNA-dihydrouridine(16/17) synthase [NAD(P)(+)]-like [Oppia nitens]|uniref:tRNA-dihydrouridine(16/17) synthase [NAD(P)(+)]-like n=1 Tax=Oppia nitens TaxID=1686743 RepID=UPI0023DB6BA6|nr:tRNA-dihydrouridine(16/17) synthase [NAD(P)(+)]-like [Oppia nitens]